MGDFGTTGSTEAPSSTTDCGETRFTGSTTDFGTTGSTEVPSSTMDCGEARSTGSIADFGITGSTEAPSSTTDCGEARFTGSTADFTATIGITGSTEIRFTEARFFTQELMVLGTTAVDGDFMRRKKA